jgi:hypothetical protein
MLAPSGSATSLPGCTPLREPVTRTVPSAAGATPRKLIVVWGVANRSPGAGETATAVARDVAAPASPLAKAAGPARAAATVTVKAATPA